MAADVHDARIKAAQEDVRALRDKLEDACQAFLTATEKFATEQYQSLIENAVVSHPDTAKEVGVEGLAKLKAGLQMILENVPESIQALINRDELWGHRGKPTTTSNEEVFRYMASGKRGPDPLDEAVRLLLGNAGAILLKHNFADVSGMSNWELVGPNRVVRSKYGYQWSDEMMTVLDGYSELYRQYVVAFQTLETAEKDKAEAEAKSLWDQA